MLTPADIDSKQFKTTRLKEGYDQDEVDSFLDGLVEDWKFVTQQLARLEQENELLRRRPTEAPTAQLPLVTSASPSGSAEKILVLAQETADRHVADAQAQADELIRQAGGKGARLVEEAQTAADKLMAEARERSESIINDGYAEKAKRLAELETEHQRVLAALNQAQTRGSSVKQALSDALSNLEGKL